MDGLGPEDVFKDYFNWLDVFVGVLGHEHADAGVVRGRFWGGGFRSPQIMKP